MTETGSMLYYEDLTVGDEWEPGSVIFTREEIVEFAKRYDPQPFHLDDTAAERHFDGVIASGWHTAAACMRPFAEEVLTDVAIIAALGIDDLVWRRAVRPDDELSIMVTLYDKQPWDDDRGRITFQLRAENTGGELVHKRLDKVLVERR